MQSINRPELIKEHNLHLVRRTLFEVGKATRQQLSALTGISNVTMGGLLGQLTETGEALPDQLLQPASGRPAQVYRYNPRFKCALMVYLERINGQTMLQAEVSDLYGEIFLRESSPAQKLSPEETVALFKRLLAWGGPVAAVSVGLPGIGFGEYLWGKEDTHVLPLSALPLLEETCGIPVQAENDVNLAALGYARKSQLPPDETLVYLYLMQDNYAGSAIFLDGKLHLGKDRFAGELPPAPYGINWQTAHTLPSADLREHLFAAVLPYLTVLAPHKLVIASDYLTHEDLAALDRQAEKALGSHRPQFMLETDFREDYREGLKQLALAKIVPAAQQF